MGVPTENLKFCKLRLGKRYQTKRKASTKNKLCRETPAEGWRKLKWQVADSARKIDNGVIVR